MTSLHRWLVLMIVVELLGGGALMARRLLRATPPEADWSLIDPATADDLRTAVSTCESPQDWRMLGEKYMATGSFTESEMCHRVACEQEPRNATLRRQWAFSLERLGLLDEANTQYRHAMELSGDEANVCRYFIGKNLLRKSDPAGARTFFEDGKKLPANLYELARLELRSEHLDEASSLYAELARRGPDLLQVNLLGYRLASARGNDEMAAQFADRVRYSPRKLQNPFDDEAKRLFQTTQQLGTSRTWTQSYELTSSGRLEAAQSLLDRLAERDRSATVIELLAELAFQRDRPAESLKLFDELQTEFGPFPRITARMGDVQFAAGQRTEARRDWLHAVQLQLGVDLPAVHSRLAAACAQAGDEAGAKRHRALGDYHAGLSVLHRGTAPQAVSAFEAAVKSDPGFTQAWFYLGEARRLSRQPTEAEAAYRMCLEQNPDHGRALAALSLLEK